jgi:hypothetical protein
MSIETKLQTRLKSLTQPNGTAIGVDLPKVGAVENVNWQAVYGADQPNAHVAFAYQSTQGSPICPVVSRPGKSVSRIPMTGAKTVCFVMAAFVVLSPLLLTAQAPASSPSKADGPVSQASDAAETNQSAELAQKLTNPLASLISIPIQNWFDFNLGPKKDGFRYTMEAQPVYPMQISKDWNLLSRTTIPVVYQQNIYGRTTQAGLSDSTESSFSFPGAYQVHHMGNRSDLPGADRHQWTAQHAQVRYRAHRSGA